MGEALGMGRVVGDGGNVYLIVDTAVDTRYHTVCCNDLPARGRPSCGCAGTDLQRSVAGEGIGTAIVDRLVAFVGADAQEKAYVTLIADVEGFYEKWGVRPVAPASRGTYLGTGKQENS